MRYGVKGPGGDDDTYWVDDHQVEAVASKANDDGGPRTEDDLPPEAFEQGEPPEEDIPF